MANPKITKLKIENFGCIGTPGISVDIDKIVVLVGANNAGKSTILRVFEAVADCAKLDIDDFHNRQVLEGRLPQVELESIVTSENMPGEEWCQQVSDGAWLVREKWTWNGPGMEPARVGYNVRLRRWAQAGDRELMPWGANNVAKSRRPKPHRVNTFDDPEAQAKAITSLLKSYLEANIKKLKTNENDETTRYDTILENLRVLRTDSKVLQQEGIADIQTQANLILEQIFPNQALKVITADDTGPISIDLLGEEFSVEMGPVNGTTFPLQKQGSGTQRTALWAILKLLADRGVKAKSGAKSAKAFHEPVGPNTAHILLIDEPEVSLHPKATQHARDVLYALPDSENWQVMITTHSPSFIDLTKDHTTIIRVEKNNDNEIEATTLYRPEDARLDRDDKKNLKLVNLFDSHISEAFFGGKVLVVEGDTEYSAFNFIRNIETERGNSTYKDLNVIRARGKVQVSSMMKVLNHFRSRYFVLHDTDRPNTKSRILDRKSSAGGRKVYNIQTIANPAWTNNQKIIDRKSDLSRVVASIVNFEEAYFAEVVDKEKPENCIEKLKTDPDAYAIIKQLLDGILQVDGVALPPGATIYDNLDELEAAVTTWDSNTVIN